MSTAAHPPAAHSSNPTRNVQKYGVSFETGALQYAARGAAMSLSLLKAVHLLEPPKDSTLANVLGTVWAAKPKTKGGQLKLPVLPQGFIQPSKNSTPFHYAFPTASRRVTCACCLFCVARTFAGAPPWRLYTLTDDARPNGLNACKSQLSFVAVGTGQSRINGRYLALPLVRIIEPALAV